MARRGARPPASRRRPVDSWMCVGDARGASGWNGCSPSRSRRYTRPRPRLTELALELDDAGARRRADRRLLREPTPSPPGGRCGRDGGVRLATVEIELARGATDEARSLIDAALATYERLGSRRPASAGATTSWGGSPSPTTIPARARTAFRASPRDGARTTPAATGSCPTPSAALAPSSRSSASRRAAAAGRRGGGAPGRSPRAPCWRWRWRGPPRPPSSPTTTGRRSSPRRAAHSCCTTSGPGGGRLTPSRWSPSCSSADGRHAGAPSPSAPSEQLRRRPRARRWGTSGGRRGAPQRPAAARCLGPPARRCTRRGASPLAGSGDGRDGRCAPCRRRHVSPP